MCNESKFIERIAFHSIAVVSALSGIIRFDLLKKAEKTKKRLNPRYLNRGFVGNFGLIYDPVELLECFIIGIKADYIIAKRSIFFFIFNGDQAVDLIFNGGILPQDIGH